MGLKCSVVTALKMKFWLHAQYLWFLSSLLLRKNSDSRWVWIDLVDCIDIEKFLVVTGKVRYPGMLLYYSWTRGRSCALQMGKRVHRTCDQVCFCEHSIRCVGTKSFLKMNKKQQEKLFLPHHGGRTLCGYFIWFHNSLCIALLLKGIERNCIVKRNDLHYYFLKDT